MRMDSPKSLQEPGHQTAERPSTRPKPSSGQISETRLTRLLLPALLTALLLWLSNFNQITIGGHSFAFACGWLGWVALVPFLVLVRADARPRNLYLAAWLAGLLFYWPVLQWMRVADYRMYATWAGLATYCSFFMPIGLFLVRRLDRTTPCPLIVSVPVVWTALEFFRAHFITGFPWYFLGHSQQAFLPLIQVSDLTGAYGVTFLVAAANAFLFELLCRWPAWRTFWRLPAGTRLLNGRALVAQGGLLVVLLGGTLAYGAWRLGQGDFETGPRVALLQSSLEQRIRNDASNPDDREQAVGKMCRYYEELCDQAVEAHSDLIIWPETSFIRPWDYVAPELPPDKVASYMTHANRNRELVARFVAQRWKTNSLLGLTVESQEADGRIRRFNSAVLICKDASVAGRYDKIHCVPFGEYVPFRDWLPWMNALAPYDFDYSITPGGQLTRFPLGPYHFGVLICYEDTDPYLARQYVRSGPDRPAVNFLVNISNDGWFDGTSEHEQHLAICRFRAIECRRAIARAVNMGISAIVDGNGRVVALPGPTWQKSKKVEAILTGSVPIDRRYSLYANWGDWLPWCCWLIVGAGCLWGLVKSRRS
jgi:apolipoprotein N-acyltransferase